LVVRGVVIDNTKILGCGVGEHEPTQFPKHTYYSTLALYNSKDKEKTQAEMSFKTVGLRFNNWWFWEVEVIAALPFKNERTGVHKGVW